MKKKCDLRYCLEKCVAKKSKPPLTGHEKVGPPVRGSKEILALY